LLSLQDYNFSAHIHMYQHNDMRILLDVNSGAIYELDKMGWDLIEKIAEYGGDTQKAGEVLSKVYSVGEINALIQDLEALIEQDALFTRPEPIDLDLLEFPVKAVCLNVAHSCNMKCQYCFANQGNFGQKPALMSLSTAKKAMEFLVNHSQGVKNLEVDFFGGEPLLVKDMLVELVAYCRQLEKQIGKRFNFTLTTNALELDGRTIDWINNNDISVILSLDGRKETNDRHRVLKNGQGSYHYIVPRIKEMVASRPKSYFVRGTFTRNNLDFTRDLEHMVGLGFDCISLEPAVGADNGFSILPEDVAQVLQEYDRLTDLLYKYHKAGRDISFFHYNLDLQKGPCLAKRMTGCGAGLDYLAITPEGDIYPCHQFVGNQDFYMGNINTRFQSGLRKIFAQMQVKEKECSTCWARNFCGGGCHANAYNNNGEIGKPHQTSCKLHQKRIEGAIYLALKKSPVK
jgi:uncharacterized protein